MGQTTMIEETMRYIYDTFFKDKLKNNEYYNHKYFPLYLSLQQLLEDETKRLEE